MKEKRFNIGDQVTYKSNTNCRNQYQDEYGEYYWGGDNQDGYVGIIREYRCYIESKDCYKIEVTAKDRDTYTMLECEFVEYDHKPSDQIPKFKIGDIVNVNNKGYQYSDPFHYDMNDIINCDCKAITHDAVKITDSQYSFKNNRWWYKYNDDDGNWFEESVFSKSEDHKPEYKSLVGRYVKFIRKVNHVEAGTCLLITEDYISDECMEIKGYGAFDRSRLANGDCGLMPEGWEPPIDMEAIQEECKKIYPIGCTYKPFKSSSTHKLEMDEYTYRIVNNAIYAHASAGCLYKNGEYATIQLPISSTTSVGNYTGSIESMRVISTGTFLGSPCAEIHIPSKITHQQAIITKRNKKSNKLVIK